MAGDRFIGWGESSYFTEYDAIGQGHFRRPTWPSGTESYRAFKQPWLGRPAEPPSIAVDPGRPRRTVYASWNGVDRGRRLAGPRRARAQPSSARWAARPTRASRRPSPCRTLRHTWPSRRSDASGAVLGPLRDASTCGDARPAPAMARRRHCTHESAACVKMAP